MLRLNELKNVLSLDAEMPPRDRRYTSLTLLVRTKAKEELVLGPFEERVDSQGYITYHKIRE